MTVRIALRGKNGEGKFALVDDDVAESISSGRVWHCNNYGYAFGRNPVDGRYELMHRVILPGVTSVDHINGDRLDNRRSNLRPASPSQQMFNRRKKKRGESPYKGVTRLSSGSWRATIRLGGSRIHLGTYTNEAEAAIAYNRAALELYGDFAYLNPVNDDGSALTSVSTLSKKKIVQDAIAAHPEASNSEIAKMLGISRTTVAKYRNTSATC